MKGVRWASALLLLAALASEARFGWFWATRTRAYPVVTDASCNRWAWAAIALCVGALAAAIADRVLRRRGSSA